MSYVSGMARGGVHGDDGVRQLRRLDVRGIDGVESGGDSQCRRVAFRFSWDPDKVRIECTNTGSPHPRRDPFPLEAERIDPTPHVSLVERAVAQLQYRFNVIELARRRATMGPFQFGDDEIFRRRDRKRRSLE